MKKNNKLISDDMAQGDSPGSDAWSVHAVDWDAVEEDYRNSGLSLDRIARKHGTSDATLRRRAKERGWTRAVATIPLPGGRKSRPPGAPAPTAAEQRRAQMVRRLFKVLDAKLRDLEARMSDEETPQSAADAERDARSLNALARLYAKLVELDQNATQQGSEPNLKDGDDADRLRRDLADRLARLDRARDA